MEPNPKPVAPTQFFLLTFCLSWLIWIPLLLAHFEMGPFHISEAASNAVRLLGVLMPAVSAMILAARSGGRPGLGRLLSGLAIWRVGWRWWGAAVLIQPFLLALSVLLNNRLLDAPAIETAVPGSPVELLVSVILLTIATLGEEIGWRGAALPALQLQYPAIKASVILGLLWAAWHLPFWLLLDTFDQFGWLYLAMNFLLVLPLTFHITWFFNRSRYSLLLVVFFHLGFNIVNTALLPVTLQIGGFGVLLVLEWLLAALILPRLESPYSRQQRLPGRTTDRPAQGAQAFQ